MKPDSRDHFQAHRWLRRLLGVFFGAACLAATCVGVLVLGLLLWSVLSAALQGSPDHAWYAIGSNLRELFDLLRNLATRTNASDPELAGYRVGIAGSLWLLGLVATTGIPVGIGAGVYLEEYAPPGRIRRLIQTNIANLAGVPSIVYGILGLSLFVRGYGIKALSLGHVLLSGVLTLSLLILPIIVITTQEALRPCPNRSVKPRWRSVQRAGRWSGVTCCPRPCPASSPARSWASRGPSARRHPC